MQMSVPPHLSTRSPPSCPHRLSCPETPAHPAAGAAAGDLWRSDRSSWLSFPAAECFHICALREAGEGTMIDLSYLTEEEQGMIMTVLKRDAELKKAEEERIRKLEQILNSSSQSDSNLKYLTGEWFYEAKSRRHMDKIHGSEIILASMKQKKTPGLDRSLRTERSRTTNSRGSDIAAPPKPARCLEALQPREINDAEKENLSSAVRSPRTPRHNPFNHASLIIVEPPENNNGMSASRAQESSETEPISPLKSHPAGEASQTSGGSLTSEGSSVGFRPVPKKRTFLSRRTCSQSESNGLGLDAQVGSSGIVPAPRRSLPRGSSGSSNQSCLKGQDEMSQKSSAAVSNEVSLPARPSGSADETSQQLLCDVSQVSSNSSQERERNPPSVPQDRPATYVRRDVPTERETPQKSNERDDQTRREHAGVNAAFLHSSSVQDSDRENSSSVGTATRKEELSLTQSTVGPEPPVSYDLNFIDKSDQQSQKKSNQKHVFKLSTQATSPTGEEEDSIAKVLDWFSRSTDSSDWLNTDDGPEDKHVDTSKLRSKDSVRKDAGNFTSDRKKETAEMKRSHLQRQTNEAEELRATDRTDNEEVTETQEEVQKDARERIRSQEVKDSDNESQPPKISHLKSFWEKNNMGPKILINKGQKHVNLSAEKDEGTVSKPLTVSDMSSAPGIYSGKGTYDEYATNHEDEREKQLVISPQKDVRDNENLNDNQKVDRLVINNDPTYTSDYLKLPSSPQVADRRGSDTEVLCVTALSSQPRTAIQSTLSPESESVSSVKPNPQLDSISQSRETPMQEELSKTVPVSQVDTDVQTRDTPDSEKLSLSRDMDFRQGGNDVQITSKAQLRRGSCEDVRRRDSDDKSMQSSMSPKRKEDVSNKDRTNSPRLTHQESTTERIKQLKSFWEQERNKPMFYTGKAKTLGEGRVARGANQAKLNKRFTKSEYDLRSIGNNSGSDEEDSNRNHHNFTVLPLNQRIEKSSPSLSTSRTQFNTLREFWDEATSDTKGSFSSDKPKCPKRKEAMSGQLPSQELKSADPEIYRLSSTVEKTRPAVLKSSSSPQSRSKSPHDRQMGSGPRAVNDSKNSLSNYTTAESRRSSKDSGREEKSTKPQSSSGKETRSPKSRKDSFSNSSSRGNSLRRATSMFALSFPDENDQGQLKIDISPVHSQSRKQRQATEKGPTLRRSSEETETLTPRARAFVPRDYRHYLGMTDKTSVHTSLAPAVNDEGSEGKTGYEFDLNGPVRTSTPVGSEERYSRKGNKTNQRPQWATYSSSDTGQESSVSSTSETWSNSRISSNRENDDEAQNPVRKALRRAEARPKNLAKSIEDITASLSPWQERRQDPAADLRRISDVSSIPSPSSSLFSDPDHLKKMSKSVPSFLQKELSGSVMTMYSGDFGNVEVQGNIQFSINYVQRLREFHIFVAECRDLAAVDPKRGRSDPYVKSYLVPDKANLGKRKTSVKKKTLNPTFNEILRYRVRMEYLRTQTLILSVWHHDTFGRNSFLGEVDVDLSKWDFDHTQMNYLALKARTTPTLAPSNGRGEMRLAIRYLPQITHSEGVTKDGPNTGEVHIWVKECKNLPLIRATIDPYVKCFVLPDTSRKSRQKTRVLRRTADPVFNHTMVYDGIREPDLMEACVELTVWDRDRLASNLLGGLRLGVGTGKSYGAVVDWMDSTPYEVALWERMMASPNEWVEDVLPLRMVNSLTKK
ncbi:synaptotagmin-like protein 2 isoform X2 [Toxotes jaculatrix]|uniref:synaptotagmin-like protein 2 isoform X2 n=1 Tax=Toxotes jaculatrix TaxID=941984 RepID=UPI001B3A961B|nr:synaptotagmin-like protein 2 isoform X2 [Toxotes jaculatrix]